MPACRLCETQAEPGRKLCKKHLEYYKTAAKRWRDKKREAGLCGICGKRPFLPGRTHCAECRNRINERARNNRVIVCTLCAVPGHHRREHKKLGLCWHCSRKAKNGLCKLHREEVAERHREKSRSVRAERQHHKVCRRCGKPSFGKTLCPPHLKYMAKWQKGYRLSLRRPQTRRTSGTPRGRLPRQ
jgi:ribosomal protein L37E